MNLPVDQPLVNIVANDLEARADVPIVLLPVRIETRYTDDGAQLRVRIYPDSAHVEALDEGVSADERTAGMNYWNAVWPTGDATDAWPALVREVGQRRAPWVAHTLTPTNLDSRPADPPAFPDTLPVAPRAAVVRTLPDRFHVFVEQDGVGQVEAVGRTIAGDVSVSIPPDKLVPLVGADDLPVLDEATRWTVDYAAAIANGMAVDVPLARPGQPVRRLLVLGVRASLDPAAGAAALERLLDAHRYSDGAEFVAQATPSNNTETDRTSWSRRAPPGPPPLTAPNVRVGANARVMASALGVSPVATASLPAAMDMEQPRAQAMATALWDSTWGEMLERLLQPQAMSDTTKAALRRHALDFVRGRGPLPALRLGREPYGVLPVMPIDASVYRPPAGSLEAGLASFIQSIRPLWRSGAQNVPTLMTGDLDKVLPEILGTSPVLRRLLVRKVTARTRSMSQAVVLLGVDDNETAQEEVTALTNLLMNVEPSRVKPNGSLSAATNVLDLPLANADDIGFIKALIAGQPAPTPNSTLQVLLGHAAALEIHRRTSIAAADRDVGTLAHAAADIPSAEARSVAQSALQAIAAGRPDVAEVQRAASTFTMNGWRVDQNTLAARQPLPGLASGTLVQQLTLNGQLPQALSRNQVGLGVLGEVFEAARRQAEFLNALTTLAGIDSEQERALLLSETLDLASHRLDAWITSLATRRLADLRAAGPGALIGAYGWIEEIVPDPPILVAGEGLAARIFESPHDGGFIHAPGLTHATTAAVLRSGRLSHQPADANSGALNIDLSSGRVRIGLEIVQGMRNGQTLGALLGYRLERWLHERSGNGMELDRFIYALRALAPLVAGKQTDPGAPQEVVAASNVVDGVHLLEREQRDPASVDQALTNGPRELGSPDGRYIVQWNPPTVAERAAVHAAIAEISVVHDAVADLLLAEGVHQLVQGNTLRAAAALDAIAAGEAVPPVPDVVRTPVSGVALTHRLLVALPLPAPAGVDGWDTSQPRARAEPALEAWAELQLGAPEPAMIAAGLCALDLVYDADGDRFDQTSLAVRMNQPPDQRTWELARALRALLVKARPLAGETLGRIETPNELSGRAQAAEAALSAAAVSLAGMHDLDATLSRLLPFGIRIGPTTTGLAPTDRETLADILVAEANRRAAAATAMIAAGRAADAFAAIFGDGFLALPRVQPVALVQPDGTPSQLSDAFTAACGAQGVKAQDGRDIRPWLARAASVRPAAHRYAEATLFREVLGKRCRLGVVQMPAGTPSRWIGLPFPAGETPPSEPVMAMVIENGFGAPLSGLEELAGFVVDEWIDVAPGESVTTGVAVNAAGPAARPPQAILLAVSPDGQSWTREKLVHTLIDTMELARIRAVTLERLPWAGRILPALYFQDWSLQGKPIIRWEMFKQRAVTRMLR